MVFHFSVNHWCLLLTNWVVFTLDYSTSLLLHCKLLSRFRLSTSSCFIVAFWAPQWWHRLWIVSSFKFRRQEEKFSKKRIAVFLRSRLYLIFFALNFCYCAFTLSVRSLMWQPANRWGFGASCGFHVDSRVWTRRLVKPNAVTGSHWMFAPPAVTVLR